MTKYFTHTLILTLFPAFLMSAVGGVCLLIVQKPGAFAWVIIVSLFAAALCPLLAIMSLLRITRAEISLFDLIAAAAISLVIVVSYNGALEFAIHEILGRTLKRAASGLLWLDIAGWALGFITLARFISLLGPKNLKDRPERQL